ncbi:MAG TPA: PQQ-binding-like beta-propeller repeat protein [Gemmatales bacterium]|nr:PQQ-binding-like beta-propeller repeat protein [Gemmatales bacterium]
MNQKPQVPWYRRWWVLLLAVLVLIVLGLYGSKVYQEWRVDQELAKEVRLLEQNEPNWRFEDWVARQPQLMADDNLALVALNLKSRLPFLLSRYDGLFADVDAFPAHRLNQYQLNELKTLLVNCAEAQAEMDQLLLLKAGVFPVENPLDPSFKVLTARLAMQQELRNVANLFKMDAQLRVEENKPDEAFKACEATLQLSRSCAQDPFVVSQFICIAIQSLSTTMIERTLAQTEPSQQSLIRLQARLLAEADVSLFKAGVQSERAGIDRFLREVQEGRYSSADLASFRKTISNFNSSTGNARTLSDILNEMRSWFNASPYGYIPEERLKLLRFYQAALALAEKPEGAALDEMKALIEKYRADIPSVVVFGATLPRIYESDQKRRAGLRMAAALLAAERYRLETGKVPAGWNDLVPKYFPSIPIDPYDGRPIRWKTTPTGFLLYSVWMNKLDDGGVIRRTENGPPQTDFGVEFFAPAHRRATPLAISDTNEFARMAILDTKEAYFAAARSGNAEMIKQILQDNFDVNTKTEYGATALCFAAEYGHLEVMKLLIEKKIDLDARDTFYNSDALTWALMDDKHEAVGLLLKAGAKGETGALSYALSQNKPKMLAAVLASGRIKQETLDSSLTSLDEKKTELVKLLTDAGAKGKPKAAKAEEKKTETTPAKTEEAATPTAPVVEITTKVLKPEPWPGFRGAGNAGVADGQFPPTAWDATTGKNLAWKTPIPGLGLSCPVVWGKRLFVTTAINMDTPKPSLRIGQYGDVDSVKETAPHTWMTYCLDADTGKILWEKKAYSGVPKVKRHMKSSHANATPAVDGRYVVVNFGSEGLYCYSIEGKLLWKKELGKLGSSWFFNPDYEWGFGSSPVIFGETVIVQCDIGKKSFIAAYSLEDGNEMWSTGREEIPSWCSPTIVQTPGGKAELVTVASKYARGYDPVTGVELWKLGKFSEIAVPTPFYAQGLIFLTTGYRPIQPIYAIKPGARGDISLEKGKETNDSIVWSKTRGGPYLPTPLVYGEHLYVCTNAGVLSCYEAKTGKVVYQKRLGGKNGYTASLVAADGRIYCTDEEGQVRVVQAGPEFKLLAINKLGEECLSHPAISNGRIYFRAREHVMAFAVTPVKQ